MKRLISIIILAQLTFLNADNYSVSFEYMDGYASSNASSETIFEGVTSFSVEVWYKNPGIVTGPNDESSHTGAIVTNYRRLADGDPYNNFILSIDASTFSNPGYVRFLSTISDEPLDDDQWHHIAGVYDHDNSVSYLFIDGVLNDTNSNNDDFLSSSNKLYINNSAPFAGEFHMDCDIAGVRITDGVRYESNFTPSFPLASEANSLIALDFSTGDGTTLADLSGNGNNFALYDAATWSTDVPFQHVQGSFDWQATTDLPTGFDEEDVSFRLIAQDVDPGIPSRQDSIHVDLNEPPSVIVTDIYAPQVADVTIYYQLADETNDTLSIIPQYLSDTTWVNATTLGQLTGITDYSGTLTWLSTNDLGRTMNPSVKFRIVPQDNDTGTVDEMLPMVVDNIQLPYAQITTPIAEVAGDYTINYGLIDLQEDTLDILCQYSADDGATWQNATVTGSTSQIPLADTLFSGSIVWRSNIDQHQADNEEVKFRIFPSDNNGTGMGAATNSFHVDNNSTPVIAITPINVEVSDSIAIQFVIIDSTSDLVTLVPEFSIDAGSTWDTANVLGILADLADSLYTSSIIWLSHLQTEGVDHENLMFRITPFDIDTAAATITSFHLDNNRVPMIELVDIAAEVHDSVDISFIYTDSENDDYTLEIFYSLDGGYTWVEGSSSTDDTSGSFEVGTWLTGQDLPNYEENSVQLIFIPYDNDMGMADTSNVFALDNYQGQKIILENLTDEQADSVFISYTIIDTTADMISLNFEYWSENAWHEFQVTGPADSISTAGYDSSVVWISTNDLPGLDIPSLLLRCVPYDEWGTGVSDSITIYLDNNEPPAVTIDPMAAEVHGEVTFNFTLIEPENDDITYAYHYSLDDSTWNAANVSVDTRSQDRSTGHNVKQGPYSVLDAKSLDTPEIFSPQATEDSPDRDIDVNITWHSFADIDSNDVDTVYFRITPADMDTGTADITNAFRVDNYQGQSVALTSISTEQSGNVDLYYSITDTTNDDSLSIRWEYSINSQTWFEIDEIQIQNNDYENTFTWNSLADLSGDDIQGLYVKATPLDQWADGIHDTIIFHLDNNVPPSVTVTNITTEQHGDISINYQESDPENDDLTFEYYYSIDGTSWTIASTTGGRSSKVITPVNHRFNKIGMDTGTDFDNEIKNETFNRNDRSTVVWNSLDDITDSDIANTYFKIIPFDPDEGIQDTTGPFNLDNYQGHSIDLTPISDEQIGDVQITFSLTDQTSDDLGIQILYSIDNGMNWEMANIEGDTSQLGNNDYNGVVTWASVENINNLDVQNVFIKAIPYDEWQQGQSDEINFHVDNETGPVLSSYVSGIIPLPQYSFELEFDRPMDPNTFENGISLTSDNTNFDFNNLNFETNSNKTIVNVFSTNGIPAFDSIRVEINNSVKDSLGKNFDGNLDGDPSGSNDDKTISVGTFMLGDFDTDGNMDFDDIAQFSMGWDVEDLNYELGPVTGEAPYLIASPDGEYDIDDLMSFIMSWNWAKQNGFLAKTIAGEFQDDKLQYDWDGNYLNIGFDVPQGLRTIHLQINKKENIIFGESAKLNEERLEIENAIFLEDTSSSSRDYNISSFTPIYMEEYDWLISIPLQIKGKEGVKTELVYEYFLDGIHYTGRKTLDLKPIPDRFHLAQNYPNPFNPTTIIQYELPENIHVRLDIIDVTGRTVRQLVNGPQEAGYQTVRWNGRNATGQQVSAGVYFYRIQAGHYMKTRKMILLK